MPMRSRSRTRVFLEPVPLAEIGTINGHYIQALTQRTTFIVDGRQAILCTPLEYQLALHLLRTAPAVPLRDDHLLAAISVDRRSLRDLITALRQKLFRPLGLEVASVPRYGYLLLEHPDPDQSRKEGGSSVCDSSSGITNSNANATQNQGLPDW